MLFCSFILFKCLNSWDLYTREIVFHTAFKLNFIPVLENRKRYAFQNENQIPVTKNVDNMVRAFAYVFLQELLFAILNKLFNISVETILQMNSFNVIKTLHLCALFCFLSFPVICYVCVDVGISPTFITFAILSTGNCHYCILQIQKHSENKSKSLSCSNPKVFIR